MRIAPVFKEDGICVVGQFRLRSRAATLVVGTPSLVADTDRIHLALECVCWSHQMPELDVSPKHQVLVDALRDRASHSGLAVCSECCSGDSVIEPGIRAVVGELK